MTDKSIEQELAELKMQLDALKAEREAARKADSAATADSVETDETADAETVQEKSETHDLAEQFKELFESLNERLEEANPTTMLFVFALGVVLGRTLSR